MSDTAAVLTPWIRIRDAASHVGSAVELRGWVTHRRSSGKVQFLVVRDGSGLMQCVAGVKDLSPEQWEASGAITQETAVLLRGTVKADPRQVGGFELGLTHLEVVALASEYPITPKEHGVDFLMDHRHLWLRSPRQQAILRVRAEIIAAFRDIMDREGFTLVDAPIFTPTRAKAPPRCSRRSTSTTRRTCRRAASSTWRPRRWRWAGSTASAPRSAPRRARRAGT